MTDAHGVARDQLRAFIERIERLEEEKKTIADDIKDVYAEAKGMGFIPAMMKKVIALRKKDEMERMEEEAILDTYLHALGMISQPDLFEEPHHPETGEVIDPKLAQTIITGMQTEIGRKALIAAVDIMIAREEAEEETHQRPSTNDEPSPEAGPQAEASPAGTGSGKLADREGRFKGEAASADLSTNSEIDPNEDREEGHSLDGNADANAGGGHVNDQRNAATHGAGALVNPASARKPLRPLCRNPGDNCGGYGSTHCASCLRASKQVEVSA